MVRGYVLLVSKKVHELRERAHLTLRPFHAKQIAIATSTTRANSFAMLPAERNCLVMYYRTLSLLRDKAGARLLRNSCVLVKTVAKR